MKFDKKYISGQFGVVLAFALLFCIGIIAFMVKTMVFDRQKWEDIRDNNFVHKNLPVEPMRGNILSADGQLMASSLPDYKVFIDFKSGLSQDAIKRNIFSKADSVIYQFKDSLFNSLSEKGAAEFDSICVGLSKICPTKTAEEYKKYLRQGWADQSRYFEICKGTTLNYIQYKDLMDLPFFNQFEHHKFLVGLNIEERNNRKKPFGSLARRTLGDMYGDKEKNAARSGLELAYDSLLKGVPGIKHREKILNKYVDVIDVKPQNGYDIVSTIDVRMQDICENALRERLGEVTADMGVVILMEVKTGDVKAIVNLSKFDDGNFYEAQNYALAALMEPGSTFKTASILVALDDKEITLNDHVNGNGGVYNMWGSQMKDHNWHKGGYGDMDVAHTLMYSSNIGVSRLIDSHYHYKPGKFVEGLHRVGIGAPLHLPFVGAADPVIRMPKEDKSNWSNTALAWMSIGYETQIPPISTVTFYNAIANNGKMVQPRFVKEIQKEGEVVEEKPVVVLKEQIARPEAIKQIQEILNRVVNDGGVGKPAMSKYVTIAGKTGTAQIGGKSGYKGGGHLVSFCGFFPAEDPKYTGIVAIRINSGPASGGLHAGTTFKNIAESIYSNLITNDVSKAHDSLSVRVPEVKRGDIDAAKYVLNCLKIGVKAPGITKGEIGSANKLGNRVEFAVHTGDFDHMPNLVGMGLRDAVYEIEKRGMKARVRGVGTVVRQSLAPGVKTTQNKTVEIFLESKSKNKAI